MAMKNAFVLGLRALGLTGDTNGVSERDCNVPENFPNPLRAQQWLAEAVSYATAAANLETPIVIRLAHMTAACNWNCVAFQDDSALNALTEERPFLTGVPDTNKNSWSRALCLSQCYNSLREVTKFDVVNPILEEKWGLASQVGIRDDIVDCGADAACLQAIVEQSEFDPMVIGQVVAAEIQEFFDQDGWNSLGSLTFDPTTETAEKCTANCRPFADTTGYYPVNHPGPVKKRDKYN